MFKFIKMMRPHQWPKQVIVFLPLISLGSQIDFTEMIHGLIAVITFIFAASVVYSVNDLVDLEQDRLDPIRRNRSLASGMISRSQVYIMIVLNLVVFSIFTALFSSKPIQSVMIISFYLVVNFFYSFLKLKRHNILGVSIVAIGFPIRFAYGCSFLGIQFSIWAIVLLMELALFMLSMKRYQGTQRIDPKGRSQGNDDFWLLSAVVFAAFFSASYVGFVSAASTQSIWGSDILLISTIPVALAVVRFIELGSNIKLSQSLDVTDSVFRDASLVLLGLLYSVIMFIGRLTNA